MPVEPKGKRREVLEAGGVGTGDGSCQALVAWRDGRDLNHGTEWGVRCGKVYCKHSALCV